MKCGLLGRKLTHSFSPQIHAKLGNYPYFLIEKEPEELEHFLQNGDFDGLNITIPYKKEIIPYLDTLTPVAQQLGAVNTVVRRNGKWIGHNTDYAGFQSLLAYSELCPAGKKCLVLGSGGASAVVQAVLTQAGANVTVISRSGENNYQNLHLHQDAALIVNTTPVGMYPENGNTPIALSPFPHLEGVIDLIYNPFRTQLLMDAEKMGIPAFNGLWMLVAQAVEAAKFFTNASFPQEKTEEIYWELALEKENIVLIGMPGCGKTTLGKAMAQRMGKQFADSDALVEELAQKSIPRIFAEDGETVFRDWETKALEILGKRTGLVIATGGGCVTQAHNYPLLRQNGRILWIQRELDKLVTEGRPLSQSQDLQTMYQQRAPLYTAFADHIIPPGFIAQNKETMP